MPRAPVPPRASRPARAQCARTTSPPSHLLAGTHVEHVVHGGAGEGALQLEALTRMRHGHLGMGSRQRLSFSVYAQEVGKSLQLRPRTAEQLHTKDPEVCAKGAIEFVTDVPILAPIIIGIALCTLTCRAHFL